MKLIICATAIYLALAFLTFLHWEFFWLVDSPFDKTWWSSPFGRGPVTIVFGPIVAATWPVYWACMLPVVGDWFAFNPYAAIAGGIFFTIALAVVMNDIRWIGRKIGGAI